MARNRLIQRYKDRNPDAEYDEKKLYTDIENEIGELESFKKKTTETDKKLMVVLKANPSVAKFIRDIAKGAPIPEAIARNFGADFVPVEGDPDHEAWEKGLEDRNKQLAEKDAYLESVNKNSEISAKTMKEFIDKNDIPEDKANEFFDMIDSIMLDAIDGKIEERTLTALYTAMTHDDVVKDEVTKATIKAKNEKIDDEMVKAEAGKKGDGLPPITSSTVKETPKIDNTPKSKWEEAMINQRNI